jgi:plasmid stability protein
MSKSIQIRNVPEVIHKKLKARAARAGMSLSDLLLAEISRFTALPTPAEMRERLRSRDPVRLTESAATAIRKERESS